MENQAALALTGRKHRLVIAAMRNRSLVVGLALTSFFLLLAVLGPFIAPYDPYEQNLEFRSESFSVSHPLGRDELGRDLLSRIIYGARYSLVMAYAVVITGLSVGSILGSISGFYGGIVDVLIMRITDVMLMFPDLLVAIVISALLGPGYVNLIIAISLSNIAPCVRLIRGQVLTLKDMEYVIAAKALGAGDFSIILKHIAPNYVAPLIIQATYNLALAILFASGLGFLGLGAQPPTPEWGVMLSRGRDYLRTSPHVVAVPGVIIAICVLGVNMLGDGLRDVLDPRLIE